MTYWRMSFRAGNDGQEMWPRCLDLGVAAITYLPLARVDLSQHPPREPKELWAQLQSSQKSSLGAVAYEMQQGDVIYVKQGPYIINRGMVRGEYQFDEAFRVFDHNNVPWPHQVPVAWQPNFIKARVLLGAEQSTVKKLKDADLEKLTAVLGRL